MHTPPLPTAHLVSLPQEQCPSIEHARSVLSVQLTVAQPSRGSPLLPYVPGQREEAPPYLLQAQAAETMLTDFFFKPQLFNGGHLKWIHLRSLLVNFTAHLSRYTCN